MKRASGLTKNDHGFKDVVPYLAFKIILLLRTLEFISQREVQFYTSFWRGSIRIHILLRT
jgi:hypothetical protein